MFEDYQICPYTGLRSFTEDESLYFKGREEHIEQATEQLQRNKFLMLTGASGDGKSSLVYAGIIPNARAGFLKSKYTQWCVADFRPERTPFKNLCKVLAKQLQISNPSTVESELQHGFSALVDLYKNSKRFIDTESVTWQSADDAGKAVLKREAANLVIMVDQFEEFFTNPENYHNGVPSRDSNLVLNVLLETARIALEEDLPIYVVFTMRSDYIGQCAAFRSLPEYIGFSQFFVPRLNRSQLQQVIEKPATLSGNKITRRLTERLILDLTEGVDQLPILQHALNQIWLAANNGSEEMDLIHYAMVGGMSVQELPDEQVDRFKQWFASLPSEIRDCYHEPDLQNVLDTHTNKLYEQASIYYQNKTGKVISQAESKTIIRTVFTCLTKIDQSRAVRNRMTLQEITDILGQPDLNTKVVGDVLNIFREPGNTFIRPFITDEPEANTLKADQVLDITHESLIRNWEYLEQWAKEEFDNYTVSLDFGQQLNRWVKSGKSSSFLFSIGPLTYFESWFNKLKPNAYWIARYLPEDISQEKKLKRSNQILSNAQELLKKSARKHVVTRTIMRYGTRKLAAVLGVIAVLVLSSFAVSDYLRQQNEFVLKDIRKETLTLLNSPKVDLFLKSELSGEALADNLISVKDISINATDNASRIKVLTSLVSVLVYQGKQEPQNQIKECLLLLDSLFGTYSLQNGTAQDNERVLNQLIYYNHTLELAYLHNPNQYLAELLTKSASYSATYSKIFLTSQPEKFTDINGLHRVMEHAINHNAFSEDELRKLISILSPFEKVKRSDWVLNKYQRDKIAVRSYFEYGFKFNGLYQELAYLYAAIGEMDKTLQCVDSLLVYNQSYQTNDYSNVLDNACNIAGTFYTARHSDKLDAFVTEYGVRKKMPVSEFYDRLLARSVCNILISDNLDPLNEAFSNGNLQYGSISQTTFFFNQWRKAIMKEYKSADERNFQLALTYKNEGLLRSLKSELSNHDLINVDSLYQEAIRLYQLVGPDFLSQNISTTAAESGVVVILPRSSQFLFPDYKAVYSAFEPRSNQPFYTSSTFMKYIVKNDLLNTLYTTSADMISIQNWIESYHVTSNNPTFFLRKRINYDDLVRFEESITKNSTSSAIDLNTLYLTLGEQSLAKKNKQDFLKWHGKLRPELIFNTVNGSAGPRAFRSYAEFVKGLIYYDNMDSAYLLVKRFKNPVNRSSIYAYAAYQLLLEDPTSQHASRALDSAYKEITRIENLSTGQPNRILIAYALALKNDPNKLNDAYKVIKNLDGKSFPIELMCRSLAFHENLFDAMQNMPPDISDSDRALLLRAILQGYKRNEIEKAWMEYSFSYSWFGLNPITYINESV